MDLDTSEKVVSLVAGTFAIGGTLGGIFFYKKRNRVSENSGSGDPISTIGNHSSSAGNTQNLTVTVNAPASDAAVALIAPALFPASATVAEMKKITRILFVDDDKGFKIVGVLKKMGWENTKLVTDVASLEQPALVDAHVVFIDIQGVGRAMQYTDEGLGLALAIKRRYPHKKVVIYSSVSVGARFHEALQEADYSLPKTAEPIRFEDTIVRVMRK